MKKMFGKKLNLIDNEQNKKPISLISNNFKPVKISNTKSHKYNSNLRNLQTCKNFYKTKSPFGFSYKTTTSSNMKTNNNSSISNSKSLKTNKMNSNSKKSSISTNKKPYKIEKLSEIKQRLNFNEKNIKFITLISNNKKRNKSNKSNVHEKINKDNSIPKLPINNINYKNGLNNINPNSNNNNNTNYSSKERQSEFLNMELGQMKNFSDISLNILDDENKEEEEKEINLEDLCFIYQKNQDFSFYENLEQSFYCNDINEMKDGEDIQKVYSMTMHGNNYWCKYSKFFTNEKDYNINLYKNNTKSNISELIYNYKISYKGNGISFRNNNICKK